MAVDQNQYKKMPVAVQSATKQFALLKLNFTDGNEGKFCLPWFTHGQV